MKAKTVELHLLQSFPPSCVNRDGNNSPKDCDFGGYRRARISSQCLKRAIRQAEGFIETTSLPNGIRSRLWIDELVKSPDLKTDVQRKLVAILMQGVIGGIEDPDENSDELVNDTPDTQEDNQSTEAVSVRSKVLLHLPSTAAEVIIPFFFENEEQLIAYADAEREAKGAQGKKKSKNPHQKAYARLVKQLVEKIKEMPQSPDLALFGRMLANNTGLNIDAASQVAHAISTHKLSQDVDYWTAVDDLQVSGTPGAGMLGTAEFNASVFYRYAAVSLPILEKNLADEELAKKAVEGFLAASFEAIPTGKVNGHAHFTPPFLALAVVREKGMPLNLCNAFLDPVKPKRDAGLDVVSAQALLSHLASARKFAPVDKAEYLLAHQLPSSVAAEGVASVEGYRALIEAVVERL